MSNIIYIYITFFILIGSLTYYYRDSNVFNETFQDSMSELHSIPEGILKTRATKVLSELNNKTKIFNKFSNIDIPIIIANNGTLCDQGSICSLDNNNMQCKIQNIISSCSNYYDNGLINKYMDNTPNIKLSKQQIKTNLINELPIINENYNTYNHDLTNIISNINDKLELENQQLNFIKYNIINLDDKTKLVDKTKLELDKKENNININKLEFTHILDTNTINDKKLKTYYNIIIGMVVCLIILGLLNLLFSKLDN